MPPISSLLQVAQDPMVSLKKKACECILPDYVFQYVRLANLAGVRESTVVLVTQSV